MNYLVTHITRYEYADTVPECFNIVRLAPRKAARQVCHKHSLVVDPKPSDRTRQSDYFENQVEYFSIHEPFDDLTVTAKNRIEVLDTPAPDAGATPPWEQIAARPGVEDVSVAQFTYESPHVRRSQELARYASVSFTPQRPILEAALDLTSRIDKDFEFDSQATTVSTPVEEVFEKRAGVCQDFAHLQIACLRSLGLPARYVSGYLRTIPPEGKPRLVGADASHAWVSLHCGDIGWIDLDPTNNVMPNTDHIVVAWGRDYFDVSPIQGVFTGGGRTLLKVSVDVMPVE